MEIAAGEYGYDSLYFRQMLEAEAVDVVQLDATRCKGFTGFLEGAAVAASFGCPISAHCAPSLHMHVGMRDAEVSPRRILPRSRAHRGDAVRRIHPPGEWRVEARPVAAGLGLIFRHQDAERFLRLESNAR